MQKEISLKLTPSEAANQAIITSYIAQTFGVKENEVAGFYTLKKSIDARSRKQIWINISVKAFINEPFIER